MMKSFVYQGTGDVGVIQLVERPSPECLPGQIKIAVRAFGLNRADLLQREGKYPPPLGETEIPGLEAAGEVLEVGTGAGRFKVGDRVMALLGSGGYSTEVCVDERLVLPLPSPLNFEQGAALIEVFLTAHHNLFTLGVIRASERALVHAGASGVGTAAIQLLKVFGVDAWVTVGSSEKAAFCKILGARALNYREVEFDKVILQETSGAGVHVVLDPVGPGYLEKNLRSLTTGGKLVCIGTMSGKEAPLNFGALLSKRIQILGSTLRSLPIEAKAQVVSRFAAFFYEGFVRGDLRPILDKVFPAHKLADAQQRMESNQNIGKIVLSWG